TGLAAARAASSPCEDPRESMAAGCGAGLEQGCGARGPWGSAPPSAPAHEAPAPARGAGPLAAARRAGREHLEAQRAGAGHCLDEADAYGVAQPIDVAGAVADEGVGGLVVAVVVVQRGR